ncbi:MAG: DUF4199 domain-containing protein [Cyclobacteriaceae bacterium]
MLKNPLFGVPIKFGTIGGAMFILMFCITYGIDKNPLIDLKFFDFILIPIFLFTAMKEYKDYRNNGILHFWQGMTVGVGTYLLMAAVSAFFVTIFLTLIDPAVIDQYISSRLEMLEGKQAEMVEMMGQSTYTKTRDDLINTSAGILALDDFLKKCLIGLLLTIPIAVILRRREL